MIGKEELRILLEDIESDRAERTISTANTDKFGEAICAFANDLPGNHLPGYLVIGADNNGKIIGTKVTDDLLKNLAAIRTDGNIQPQPSMVVEKMSFKEGDLAVVEVQPSSFPPMKYKGRIWVRVGPRRAVANEDDEKKLFEKRRANITKFDEMPYIGTTLDEIDIQLFKTFYLPKALPEDVLSNDTRPIENQLESLGFYDTRFNCPTYAGILFFGKNVARLMPSAYVQYVRFEGLTRAGEILMEHKFSGNLCTILPQLDVFIDTTIKKQRPLSVSALREKPIFDYPYWATRELVMNAICHRDYETSGPIQFYQYDDRIEIMNHGWLFGRANEENFPNVNDYRNEVVAEGMRVLGFANRFSHGVLRVKNDLVANGNGEPEYDFSLKTAVLVKEFIAKHPEPYVPPIKSEDTLPENVSTDIQHIIKELTDRQRDIYDIIRSSVGVNVGVNVGVKAPMLADKLKVNQRTIERDLFKLKEKGLIRYVGSPKNGHWEPSI